VIYKFHGVETDFDTTTVPDRIERIYVDAALMKFVCDWHGELTGDKPIDVPPQRVSPPKYNRQKQLLESTINGFPWALRLVPLKKKRSIWERITEWFRSLSVRSSSAN
jgi:hypothetical protein